MSPPASSSKRLQKSKVLTAQLGRPAIAFALALALLAGMVWDRIEDGSVAVVQIVQQSDDDSNVVVLPIANAILLVPPDAGMATPSTVVSGHTEACPAESTGVLALIDLPAGGDDLGAFSVAPRTAQDVLDAIGEMLAAANGDSSRLIDYARRKMLPQFFDAYRSVFKLATLMGLGRVQDDATLARATIVGVVSTYNPYRDRVQEGDGQTASGEPYDPAGWTAAVQVDLRHQFGGVRFGRLYQPTYALVESGEKQLIVRINDVGTLRPGRVLDLNEKSMRHFDPFLTRGLLADAKITLLPGEDWTPGPVIATYAIDFAATEPAAVPTLDGSVESIGLPSGPDLAGAPHAHFPDPSAGEAIPAEATASEGG